MGHDTEIPAGWNKMSKEQRTEWLARWFDYNVELHQLIAKMNRTEAEKTRKNYRKRNRLGKRRK